MTATNPFARAAAAAPHPARPAPVSADAPGLALWVKPFVCRTCGEPITHVHAGTWKHTKEKK